MSKLTEDPTKVIRKALPIMALVTMVSLVVVACGSDPEVVTTTTKSPPPPERPATPVPVEQDNGSGSNSGDGTPVTVELQDIGGYKFVESELSFKAGETVSFTFESEAEFHTFTVDDLDIDVSVDSGAAETLTFTFDSPGTYKLICVPHESQGMTGTITVQ